MIGKIKIVLDADVIIHFIQGDSLSLLFEIFPEYGYIILDVVYDELTKNRATKIQLDNTLNLYNEKFSMVYFLPAGQSRQEYARLISTLGRGESACMVYCRDNQDVLGSSNLRDIKKYCEDNQITYLTTLDFLYYAFIRYKMSAKQISEFISQVKAKGSKLPSIEIETYIPTCHL
ncbi:MAG: hypothetical protein J1F07_04995 [Muribaculaceae bacterium]|nr:hypothetical protein [Muribaculaceae bacterium]